MLPKLDCPICATDIGTHYDQSSDITVKNQRMLELAVTHRQGHKLLSAGRVVILRDGVRSLVLRVCQQFS